MSGVAGCGSGQPSVPPSSPPSSPSAAVPEPSGIETPEPASDTATSVSPPSLEPPDADMSASAPAAAAVAESAGQGVAQSSPTASQWRAWTAALAGEDVKARETAAAGLDRVAAVDPQPLWTLLEDAAPEVRRGAIFYWLDRFDPADSEAVAALRQRLTDQDPAVRAIALSAARRFPSAALLESLPPLSLVLADRQSSAETRAAAARLIGTLEAPGREAVPVLTQAAGDDPDPSVRSACLLSLGRVAAADQAVAVLLQALQQDAEANVRGLAAVRLGRFGPAAAAAAPRLADALADGDESVRRKAADALAELGPAAVTPIIGKLDAADVGVRRLAVFVLGKLGTHAKPALQALGNRLQDPDAEVKQLAELAIRRIEGTER